MGWTYDAWKVIVKAYHEVVDGIFVSELAKGTLCEERFLKYIVQSQTHLKDKTSNYIPMSDPVREDSEKWSQFNIEAFATETRLCDICKKKMEFADENMENIYIKHSNLTEEIKELSQYFNFPTNDRYSLFLLKHAMSSPLPIALAAILPCFWINSKVNSHNNTHFMESSDNIYEECTKQCAQNGIEISTEFINRIAEKAEPEVIDAMENVFYIASICELDILKSVYGEQRMI